MTETTTQPYPQVVAWMRGYLRDNLDHDYIDATNAYFIAHPYDMTKDPPGMRASYEAARKPVTVADIPAGQGAASLFIATDGHGHLAAWFMRSDGHAMHLLTDPGPDAPAAEAALWGHLAAHLPTVTDATEEVDLTPLFDTPQIHTDSDSRHWDDTGREHRAVDVDGELTYQPAADATEESK